MRTRVTAVEVSGHRLRAEASAHVEWPQPKPGEALLESGAPLRESVPPLRMQRWPQQHRAPTAALGVAQLEESEPGQGVELTITAQLIPQHDWHDIVLRQRFEYGLQ